MRRHLSATRNPSPRLYEPSYVPERLVGRASACRRSHFSKRTAPPPKFYSDFDFTCDEETCYYEVRVFDADESLEVCQPPLLRSA